MEVYVGTKFRTVALRPDPPRDAFGAELLEWCRRWAAAGYIGHNLTKYVAGGILILTGAYTIWQGWGLEKTERPQANHSLIVTAMALSIDNLAVGFALAVYHIQIVLAAVTMGVVSVVMSLVGLELGHRLGKRVEGWSEEIGGGVLILVGIAIAVGLLG